VPETPVTLTSTLTDPKSEKGAAAKGKKPNIYKTTQRLPDGTVIVTPLDITTGPTELAEYPEGMENVVPMVMLFIIKPLDAAN
jgi:hypothetical protein